MRILAYLLRKEFSPKNGYISMAYDFFRLIRFLPYAYSCFQVDALLFFQGFLESHPHEQ
jgi:hypothetical protein